MADLELYSLDKNKITGTCNLPVFLYQNDTPVTLTYFSSPLI
jgi:hypothetical protein